MIYVSSDKRENTAAISVGYLARRGMKGLTNPDTGAGGSPLVTPTPGGGRSITMMACLGVSLCEASDDDDAAWSSLRRERIRDRKRGLAVTSSRLRVAGV